MSTTTVPDHQRRWWHAPKGAAHRAVFDAVRRIESDQWMLYDRFVKLEALYDPFSHANENKVEQLGLVTENVISSNVDTVAALVATSDIRSRYMTDGGDWSVQRTARHLEWYSEGLAKLLGRRKACHAAFKAAAKKGTGLVAVYVNRFKRIVVEEVLVDDVVVPVAECRNGQAPRQMHRRTIVDREELKAEWPKHKEQIDKAQQVGSWRKWADYRPLEPNEIVKLESWRLPIGEPDDDEHYVEGRHTITIDGFDLLDEEWEKPFFPIHKIVWTERTAGWYGISLTEGIAGHQHALNKMNWQADRQLDQIAVPTTYVSPIDANATVKSNRAGNFCVVKGAPPVTVIPQAVSGEVYNRMEKLKESSYAFSGVSRMASQAVKPAGIDSGVAMREYRDQTTQRFAPQEREYEEFSLRIDWAILDCCKDLGADAPTIARRSRFGQKRIKWADVDLKDIRVFQAAASTLGRTPAGRTQLVLELAQAGLISQDESRRLMRHPDLEAELSLWTAALESIEHDFDEIADGNIVMPEPYTNLAMCEWRGQREYLVWGPDGAPEDRMEALRQYIVQAIAMKNMATAEAANGNVAMGAAAPAPAEAPPQAALAEQAMQLRSA